MGFRALARTRVRAGSYEKPEDFKSLAVRVFWQTCPKSPTPARWVDFFNKLLNQDYPAFDPTPVVVTKPEGLERAR